MNYTIDQWKFDNIERKIILQKCIQHIMKENLLLLKDFVETKIIKFTNRRLHCQKWVDW